MAMFPGQITPTPMKAGASDIRNQPAYGPAEAARYLRLPAATLTAEALAGRLQAALADDFSVDGHAIRVDVGIGVAVFPLDGEDATTLVGNAEAALHQAKAEGRGGIRFFTSAATSELERLREQPAVPRASNESRPIHPTPSLRSFSIGTPSARLCWMRASS